MVVNMLDGAKQVHKGPILDGYVESKQRDLGNDGIFGNLAWDVKDSRFNPDDFKVKSDDKARLDAQG